MERGVSGSDGGQGFGDAFPIGTAEDDLQFVLGQACIDAVADAAEAVDGSVLPGGRKGHAGGTSVFFSRSGESAMLCV